MTRKISHYFISFISLLVVSFCIHDFVLNYLEVYLPFSLLHIYFFHCFTSLVICMVIILLSNSKKWSAQLGFLYLFALINKFAFFALTFKGIIFQTEKITKIESLNLLIPLFLFLFLEVYCIVKVLNK